MTFQDFHNLKSGHKRHDRIIQIFSFGNYQRISVSIETSAKCRYFTVMSLRAVTLFFKTSFIHGVYAVLSLYAVFAFQNYRLWWAETKGQRCFQEN